jgi:hypothetical protein
MGTITLALSSPSQARIRGYFPGNTCLGELLDLLKLAAIDIGLAPLSAFGIDRQVAQSELYVRVIAVLHDRQNIGDLPRRRASFPAHIVELKHEATFTIQGRDGSCEYVSPPSFSHFTSLPMSIAVWPGSNAGGTHHPFRPKRRPDNDVPDSRRLGGNVDVSSNDERLVCHVSFLRVTGCHEIAIESPSGGLCGFGFLSSTPLVTARRAVPVGGFEVLRVKLDFYSHASSVRPSMS